MKKARRSPSRRKGARLWYVGGSQF
ncbi:J [Escherichia phage alpha3]|uniref:DNA-binding protein J n=4 Tax=Alphatrevirus TaxID=1910951 RepID=J_BPAL3|nr:core protein, DNA condensation [Escherichia phage alpha3]NP_043948.1 J [Escherichia phage phiK] [Escherichia phage phiK]YP_002985211.1 gpJ [Escherichia phage St-1]P69548.1 RecName: Full=DNA-binding protein J; AltName: Full=J protein; AltName: Full=Small core protein [Escherichia phage alpha3]P69549.1 RecName: Full=DNA-binding protein J; AltName: Full=J protein; AltName: Full=Small core protein [Alphatrevirus phiK]1M06_J Chain J, Small core protein [Escherichia phage alpha3]AAZ38964.1 gpJ [